MLAISEEDGLEHYGIYKDCVTQTQFIDYLDNLYVENKHLKIAILMDNFSAHKTQAVLQKMDELGIPSIYNVPYQPSFNPSEACFSKIKNYYKRRKLNILLNDEEINVLNLIHESVQ